MAQSNSRKRRKASRRETQRDLGLETLDARTLLTVIQDDSIPEDASADGEVSALDALMVINRMNRGRNADPDVDRAPDRDPVNPSPVDVQSIDGTGNNLQRTTLGAAGTALARIVDADYADGIAEPAGGDRLSAREISNLVFDQDESIPSEKGLSNLV